MDRRLSGTARAVVMALLLASAAGAQTRDGDTVSLGGQVVDGDGQPVAEVSVVLEASRRHFSLRHFEKRQGAPLRMPTVTDDQGRFRFEWIWDRHYNHFELAVGLEVSRGGQPDFEIFKRQDVTADLTAGAPPGLRIKLDDVRWIGWLKLFIAGDASDAEKKVYRELGRPQKLTVDGTTSAWWYFEAGKVYRFDGGRLDQVIHFDPVTAN